VARIVTERLVLETLTADEAAAIRADDRQGRHWAADYPTDGDRVVAAIIGEAGDAYDEAAPLGVLQARLGATGEAVGGVGFLSAPDPHGEAEVGYGFAASAHGRGLATEALEAVIGWAAGAGVTVVVALTTEDNVPSQRVLERCAFARDGVVVTQEGRMLRWARRLRD
jgi:RimJ/RimL family protein N-acetyltransferase